MKSPITGKEMKLIKEKRVMQFRKESIEIWFHFYLCEDSKEKFESTELSELNQIQVLNEYRVKNHIPFPDEIAEIRHNYGISAKKMSEILGFGPNGFGLYEKGEIPSISNARLIRQASDPGNFLDMLKDSPHCEVKLLDYIKKIINTENEQYFCNPTKLYFESISPSISNGYRKFSWEKIKHLVFYFAKMEQPFKTRLNKLLFYTDFLNYRKTGFSITGLQYTAINFGPVPNYYEILLNELDNTTVSIDYLKLEDTICEKIVPEKYVSFNEALFTENELLTIKNVCNQFMKIKTEKLIEYSHDEIGWTKNHVKKTLISYDHAFDLKHIDIN